MSSTATTAPNRSRWSAGGRVTGKIRSFEPGPDLRRLRPEAAGHGRRTVHRRPALAGRGPPASPGVTAAGSPVGSDAVDTTVGCPAMATIVFFHAHPDDEAIATAGTMAALSDARPPGGPGHRHPRRARGDPRGPVGARAKRWPTAGWTELTEACRILGVARQTYLDYLDSGMAGEATNDRPGSFAAADIDEAAAALAGILTEEAADVLVTYDEHGGYGHPDHVQVHRVGMRAAELAGTPVVYMATMNRDFMRSLAEQVESSEWEPPEGSTDGMDTMGEPAEPAHHRGRRDPMDRSQAPGHDGSRQPDQRDQLLPGHARRRVLDGLGA